LDAALKKIAPCEITRLSPLWALVPAGDAPAVKRMLSILDGTVILDYSVPVKRAFDIDENLRIQVPIENLDLWLRARLEQFSDPLKKEAKFARFQLSREAFHRAITLGLKPEDVLLFLRDLGPDPLPADVDLTLRGWGGAIQPIALSGTVALVAQRGLISALASVEELRQLLWLDVNDTVALVREADVSALQAALERRGIQFGASPESHLGAPPQRRKPVQTRSHIPSHRRIISKMEIQSTAKKTPPGPIDTGEEITLKVYARGTTLKLLESATETAVCVVIDYAGKNRRAVRTIEPLDVYNENGSHYIDAMDRLTNELRQFRVDRIRGLFVTDEEFDPHAY